MTILIFDPGHGGKDPGGGSNKYFMEKDKVLKISLYQEKRFKELGIDVIMTRTTDKYIDSTPRANLLKNSGAKYCISNHINAGGGEGAETIHSIYSEGKLATKILLELKNEGQKIRRAFSKKNNSGTDWYYMHRLTGSVETIIVEYGIADNVDDTKRIRKNWKRYAEVVVKAFCEHIGYKYVAPGKKEESKPSKPSKPSKKPSKPKANLKIDGYMGPLTIKALQRYFGTPVDGYLSKPSLVIKALQKSLKVKQDGYMGPITITAMQKRFGTPQDGFISRPSLVIKALQRRLNAGKL